MLQDLKKKKENINIVVAAVIAYRLFLAAGELNQTMQQENVLLGVLKKMY